MLEELMKLTKEELLALLEENFKKYEFSLIGG